MKQIELTSKLVLALIAVVLATALVMLPYQNQVANAAPAGKKYQVYVTLTSVPANADNLLVNATLNRSFFTSNTLVSSPSTGDTVKFVITVPSGTSINDLIVCGTQQANPTINDCDIHTFTSKVSGPIRVDLIYPQ